MLSRDNIPGAGPRGGPAARVGGPRRGKSRDPLPALSYLKGTELGATWDRLAALGRDLHTLQPNLPLVPLKLERQVLVVTAGSAAIAARLRQFEPRLIQGLRARGWLIGRIRFRPTSIHDAPSVPPRRDKAPVSESIVDRVDAIDDPDMPAALRAAMRDFVARQRTYRRD